MPSYNCLNCPGYCCSYPLIALTKADVERLAKHHDISFKAARKSFTREAYGRKYVMLRKKDVHYGRICMFFDTKKRCCTIYKARPKNCREYPGENRRCGYYDFLMHERTTQNDDTFVAITNHKD